MFIYIPLGSLFSERSSFCKSLGKQVKFIFFLLPYLLTLYFYFLTKLWILWGVFPREWVTKTSNSLELRLPGKVPSVRMQSFVVSAINEEEVKSFSDFYVFS